ncbi:hypothetical protein M8C21_017810 [Ambrosia artemisiifolia]|uniref:Uncharacterized protein n=1 Tax=Ambrosia artemisiifolia TaxID=4212 RepID=A0AAD5DAP3_AMBAR|nr:hypothetical protein M8C21_017810 [Ambrosia artemisiifolia]
MIIDADIAVNNTPLGKMAANSSKIASKGTTGFSTLLAYYKRKPHDNLVVKTTLKTLEDGGNVEDAKVVCEPNVLHPLIRWKNKLSVFLAPFLIGTCYASFGRYFTKVDRLKELSLRRANGFAFTVQIVNRLHWYVFKSTGAV